MREDSSKNEMQPTGNRQDSYLKDLQWRASMDMLSGLLNRAATERAIKDRLLEMGQGDTCALFIVDLDNFKQVNDMLGHQAGDQAIRQAAEKLSSLFRASDIVGRLGGDEFVVFLYGGITKEIASKKAAAICEKLQLALGDRETVYITASVGVHIAGKGQTFEGLYQSADLALYKAKKAGKHLAEKAERAMRNAHTEHFAQALSALPHIIYDPISGDAAQGGQFIVYFQPKVDMRTGALAGAEALVRRIGEDGAIIPPAQFIPLMEDTGAIRELDLFVLERSLAQAEQWRSAGLGIVPIAVNLSRTTLAHPATLASVLAIQSRYPDIPESALELEITERGDRMSTAELQNFVERFRACGLHMSLDDFGSQYANLSLFTNVKFETVKLDRSLIADLGGNPISRMLVRDLVEICKSCNVTCVAEGVETEEQISALLEMGCVYVQGFYYDRPLPADVFEQKYLRGGVPARINEAGKE